MTWRRAGAIGGVIAFAVIACICISCTLLGGIGGVAYYNTVMTAETRLTANAVTNATFAPPATTLPIR